ncbi:response regulator transcription factor [Duganella levis]|uniref:Response regulator n=1 Tax=Duganella levis TaxID=2692169 RepID=A0ABW9VTA9_9BURK|nr:response regulator [Duganella levis]MYN24851.1 response regulator [Duganella levis]
MFKPHCIFLVDDDEFILRSIERLFYGSRHEVQAFASPRAFLACADLNRSGCVVLDLSMPEMPGSELQQHLLQAGSLLPVIFLTGNGDVANSVAAMKLGASDFLTKPVDADVLLAAVEQALTLNFKRRKDRAVVADIESRLALLTKRETEVMELVVQGRLNKQIAAALGTVEHTIKLHRASVMRKMRAESISDLVTVVNTLRMLRPR